MFFSGVAHSGGGEVQIDKNGQVIVLSMPTQLKLNGFIRKEFKIGSHEQSVQLNVDNILDDTKLYGQIYNPPISFRLTYGVAF